MPKQITVRCSAQLAGLLEEALHWFVASHYPHGADECSIAARETLLDLAARFGQELAATGQCVYSSRVRAFLCEAVNSYTRHLEQHTAQCWEQRRGALIAVCRGLSDGKAYCEAAQRDGQAPTVGGR